MPQLGPVLGWSGETHEPATATKSESNILGPFEIHQSSLGPNPGDDGGRRGQTGGRPLETLPCLLCHPHPNEAGEAETCELSLIRRRSEARH